MTNHFQPAKPTGYVMMIRDFRRAINQCSDRLSFAIALTVINMVCHPATATVPLVAEVALTPLPQPVASLGAATAGGYLYVYGGHIGEQHDHSREHVLGSFQRQRLSGGPWESLASGPELQSPALVAHDGKLYRIGGLSARNSADETPDLHSVASVDCYDQSTDEWTSCPPLPTSRSSHDAVVVDNRIYVVGGWAHHGDEGEGDWLDDLLMLDLSAKSSGWRKVAKTPFQRRALALAAADGKLFVIGGMTDETDFSRRVDIYDLMSGDWSRGRDLPESDWNGFGASAFTIGGRLYASSMSDQLLVLDSEGERWLQAAELEVPRFFHRLIPGPAGTALLVAGANDEDGHLASITCVRLEP